MSEKDDEQICKALGIATTPALVPAVVMANNVTFPLANPPKDNDALVKHEAEDYEKARSTLHNLIDEGADAALVALNVARSAQKPREFEAAARLMETVAALASQLHDLQDKTRRIRSYDDPAPVVDTTVSVDKAVFIGTTAELLSQVQAEKRKRRKNDEDT